MCTLEAIARALQYLGEPAELYATMLAPLQMIGQIQARFRQQSQAAPKANALASLHTPRRAAPAPTPRERYASTAVTACHTPTLRVRAAPPGRNQGRAQKQTTQ